jgi:hypothetical protein
VQATKTREHSAVGGGYGLLAEAQSGEEAEHGVPESV